MNWLDLGLLVFAIIFVVIGIRKGFMTSMLSHFSFSINALLSFFLCKPIGLVLNKLFGLQSAIASSYHSTFVNTADVFSTNLMTVSQNELSGVVSNAIDGCGKSSLEKWLFKIFINKPSLYSELHESGLESRTMADILSNTYASFFTTLISFVTSLVLLYLLVLLFRLIAKKLREVGFIRIVDNIFGAFYGLIRCLLILIVVSCIIKILSPMAWIKPAVEYINGSFFGQLIYTQISDFFNNFLNFNDIIRAIIK